MSTDCAVYVPNPVILVSFSYVGANDFSQLTNEVLSLPSTTAVSTAVCRDIAVTADMIVEENEMFTISVQSSNPYDVIMGPTTATVTIMDDDSKYINRWSQWSICITMLKILVTSMHRLLHIYDFTDRDIN